MRALPGGEDVAAVDVLIRVGNILAHEAAVAISHRNPGLFRGHRWLLSGGLRRLCIGLLARYSIRRAFRAAGVSHGFNLALKAFPGQFCRIIRQVGPSHCLRNNRCNPLSDALSPGTPPTLRGTHRRARFTPTPRGGGRMTLPTAEGQQETTFDLALISALKDRKSTRLNSSHVSTSYAVFCLKKKTPASGDMSRL